MNITLQKYIDPRFHYVFTQGPDVVSGYDDAITNGLNCIALSHLVINDLFGYKLPRNLKSSELSSDSLRFDRVDSLEDMKLGDLVWFGLANSEVKLKDFKPNYRDSELVNWEEFPIKHVAIYTGEKLDGDYLMLHATSREGTTVVWPLSRFKNYDTYKKLYFIRRLKNEYRNSDKPN